MCELYFCSGIKYEDSVDSYDLELFGLPLLDDAIKGYKLDKMMLLIRPRHYKLIMRII